MPIAASRSKRRCWMLARGIATTHGGKRAPLGASLPICRASCRGCGLRSAAQMISYDVAMGLSFVAVFLYSGTLSTSAIVNQQESGWYIWLPAIVCATNSGIVA